jgi:hypothetical protein
MREGVLVKRLDEILRICKDQLRKMEHFDGLFSRAIPGEVPGTNNDVDKADGNRDVNRVSLLQGGKNETQQHKITNKKPSRWHISLADFIQAVIGFLLLFSLRYSIESYNLTRENGRQQLRAWVGVPQITFFNAADLALKTRIP